MEMRRRWNWLVYAGFAVVLLGVGSYIPVFVRYPITRDFPWVNLLLLAAGLVMGAMGLIRAFADPQTYRGKVSGVVLGVLSLALCGLFGWGIFVASRELPAAKLALGVGAEAPDFTLADTGGSPRGLSNALPTHRAVLLVFYRGYW